MNKYEKTPNLFVTHVAKPNIGRYDLMKYRCPSFNLVKPDGWIYTEKIDGMNMRIIVRRDPFEVCVHTDIRGRSDKAQIPGDLKDNILEMFANRYDKFDALVGQDSMSGVTLYGEGYGPGIQKGGGDYRADKGFVLFDIARWIEHEDGTVSQFYLGRDDVEDIAENCGLTVAPRIFPGLGLGALTKRVQQGFASTLAIFKGKERKAEGIIAQAPGLWHFHDGKVRRLKFKLKTAMFVGDPQ